MERRVFTQVPGGVTTWERSPFTNTELHKTVSYKQAWNVVKVRMRMLNHWGISDVLPFNLVENMDLWQPPRKCFYIFLLWWKHPALWLIRTALVDVKVSAVWFKQGHCLDEMQFLIALSQAVGWMKGGELLCFFSCSHLNEENVTWGCKLAAEKSWTPFGLLVA